MLRHCMTVYQYGVYLTKKYILVGAYVGRSTMSDDEVNESTVRVSLRIPARMVDRIDEIRGPYRDRTSMILEMIGTYLDEYDVREKERIAQGSEEYQRLLAQIRKDLGLAQPPEAG